MRNTKDRMPGPGGGNLQSTGKITAAILENGLINSFYFKEMRICSQRVKKFTFVSSVADVGEKLSSDATRRLAFVRDVINI